MALLWTRSNIFWCVKRPQGMPSPTLLLLRQAADAPVIKFPDVVDLTWRWLSYGDVTECNVVENEPMKFKFPSLSSCTRHSVFYLFLSHYFPVIPFSKASFCPFLLSWCHFLLLTDFSPNSTFLLYLSHFFYCICSLCSALVPYLHLYISCWSLLSTSDFL